MTQHNIHGSEAFSPSPHVEIRVGRQRRPLHPGVKLCLIASCVGVVAGMIDTVIGAPVALTFSVFGWIVFATWPSF